jgi:hypothetical protein
MLTDAILTISNNYAWRTIAAVFTQRFCPLANGILTLGGTILIQFNMSATENEDSVPLESDDEANSKETNLEAAANDDSFSEEPPDRVRHHPTRTLLIASHISH